jgi:hypothetical protein
LKYALKLYGSATAHQALVFNGPSYQDPPISNDEDHPYFPTSDFENGSVWYDGDQYDSLPMLYDCWQDELVLEHIDQKGSIVKMKLFKGKVGRFELQGHTFVLQKADSGAAPAFYELLYEGTIKVLARRRKVHFTETSTQLGVSHSYSPRNELIVVKENQFHRVSGKKAALKVLADKRPALQAYAKDKGLTFKDRKESDMVALAEFYDRH